MACDATSQRISGPSSKVPTAAANRLYAGNISPGLRQGRASLYSATCHVMRGYEPKQRISTHDHWLVWEPGFLGDSIPKQVLTMGSKVPLFPMSAFHLCPCAVAFATGTL